jgi:hypothetical protein
MKRHLKIVRRRRLSANCEHYSIVTDANSAPDHANSDVNSANMAERGFLALPTDMECDEPLVSLQSAGGVAGPVLALSHDELRHVFCFVPDLDRSRAFPPRTKCTRPRMVP